MADQKLTQRPAVTTLDDADLVHVVTDPAGTPITNKITVANFRTEMAGAGGASIIPTLSDPGAVSGYTWVNQELGTAIDSTIGSAPAIYLSKAPAVTGTGFHWALIHKTSVPGTTPWTWTVGFIPVVFTVGAGTQRAGIGLYDTGTGKFISFTFGTDTTNPLEAFTWNSTSSVSGSLFAIGALRFFNGPMMWFRITDNGTNWLYSISADGVNFFQLFSHARNTFITANKLAIMISSQDAAFITALTLLSSAVT